MFILSVLNKKGGVGKTTIATNLAQGLTILGKKVLIVDNDEQHNLTTSVGIFLRNCTHGLADVLSAPPRNMNKVVESAVYSGFIDNLDCIPGGRGLDDVQARSSALKEALCCPFIEQQKYDAVIIDNAPTLGHNTICAINASTHFLLPVQLRQFAINGLAEMYQILTTKFKITPERIMILRNMYKKTLESRRIASDAIAASYPESVLETIIPDDETFERMIANGKSMFFSKTKSNATLLFQDLICEIFDFDKNDMMNILFKEIKQYRIDIAKTSLEKARIKGLFV
jgi:chromosome partitioning protein